MYANPKELGEDIGMQPTDKDGDSSHGTHGFLFGGLYQSCITGLGHAEFPITMPNGRRQEMKMASPWKACMAHGPRTLSILRRIVDSPSRC